MLLNPYSTLPCFVEVFTFQECVFIIFGYQWLHFHQLVFVIINSVLSHFQLLTNTEHILQSVHNSFNQHFKRIFPDKKWSGEINEISYSFYGSHYCFVHFTLPNLRLPYIIKHVFPNNCACLTISVTYLNIIGSRFYLLLYFGKKYFSSYPSWITTHFADTLMIYRLKYYIRNKNLQGSKKHGKKCCYGKYHLIIFLKKFFFAFSKPIYFYSSVPSPLAGEN